MIFFCTCSCIFMFMMKLLLLLLNVVCSAGFFSYLKLESMPKLPDIPFSNWQKSAEKWLRTTFAALKPGLPSKTKTCDTLPFRAPPRLEAMEMLPSHGVVVIYDMERLSLSDASKDDSMLKESVLSLNCPFVQVIRDANGKPEASCIPQGCEIWRFEFLKVLSYASDYPYLVVIVAGAGVGAILWFSFVVLSFAISEIFKFIAPYMKKKEIEPLITAAAEDEISRCRVDTAAQQIVELVETDFNLVEEH